MGKFNFKICVFAADFHSFEKRRLQIEAEIDQFIIVEWCPSAERNRLSQLSLQPNSWIFFIDADCRVSKSIADYINRRIPDLEKSRILAGHYVNPVEASYLQRVQNLIANAWLQERLIYRKKPALLGGAFLIHSDLQFQFKTNEDSLRFWGAEDKWIAKNLVSKGYQIIYDPNLVVLHETSSRFSHFIKRAWFHGLNDVSFLKERFKFQFPTAYFYWIRKIEKLDWHLIPAIVLHFLIQKTAKLIHSIPLWNRRLKPWRSLNKLN